MNKKLVFIPKTAKIIGKVLFFVFFIFNFNTLVCSELILEYSSVEGLPIKQVGIGIPFHLTITFKGDIDEDISPDISKLKKFKLKGVGTSSNISIINGKTLLKKIYKYELIINQEGQYSIGPVQIKSNNNIIKSNKITVDVGLEQENYNSQKKTQDNKPVILKLSLKNDKKIFINQEIILKLKLYFDNNVKPISIEKSENEDIYYSKIVEKDSGTENINDKIFNFQEWEYTIFPKKSGRLVVPAMKIIFEKEKQISSNLTALQYFMGGTMERTQVYSNALPINIYPLPEYPEYNGKVDAIGIFKNFTATVNQNSAMQGEGIVLKLDIEGKGNFDELKISKLILNNNTNYYDSKSSIQKLPNDFLKKSFEFIIQISEVGITEIPKQEFVFFNPETESYETIKTKPITLDIKPYNRQDKKDPVTKTEVTEQSILEPQAIQEIEDIYDNYKLYNITYKPIKLKYFFVLILLPLIIRLLLFIKNYFNKNENYKFKLISVTLKSIEKKKDYAGIYKIFIYFFTYKFNVHIYDVINQEFIKNKFKQAKISDKVFDEWNDFFNLISEMAFYNKDKLNISQDIYNNIFETSNKWLIFLEKNL